MFSRVTHRIIAIACVAHLMAIAVGGQSLHRLAGFDHGCSYDCVPSTRGASRCCNFSSGTLQGHLVCYRSSVKVDNGLAVAPHACTICRALAQAAQVVWEVDAGSIGLTPGSALLAPIEDPVVALSFLRYSPRGPPA